MASVLITGSAKGLGKSMAIYFAKKGYNIALHHFSDPKETYNQIISFGVKCKTYYADLTLDNIDFFDLVKNDFSDLEILINNASFFSKISFDDLSTNEYDRCFNIHVKNPLFLSKEFAKLNNSNLIINISDALAKDVNTNLFIHSFTKNTMLQMTKILAKELSHKIRVNAICPGYILGNNLLEANKIAKKSLLHKYGLEENIIQGIDYLYNNKYVTGQILDIDGGM